MLTDFIIINRKLKIPVYMQIYSEIKSAVEKGNIREEEKLPSIRRLCADLNVSKTTVESAYNQLCSEGYIVNLPQKGYFVEKGLRVENKIPIKKNNDGEDKAKIKYDFSGKGIDSACSNIKEWRRYVRGILNREYLLNTYGKNQGEEKLRKALEKYAFTVRGVNTRYDNIIIGSGSQTLIYILCGMIGLNKTVAIEKNTYPQAEQVFRDFNYNICYTKSDNKGTSAEYLEKIKPDVLLLNPNFNGKNGMGMPIARKLEIISYAKENDCIIIEDDYNGELRYRTHPTASLQSYSVDSTVYIGSFSKILLPSVRISYMALPDKLLSKYLRVRENYNQTASKVEQLALAEYITEGKLEKHLRKSRRYYRQKSEIMQKAIEKYFNSYLFNETSMYFEVSVNVKDVKEKLGELGVKAMATTTDDVLRLSFSDINSPRLEEGVNKIADIIKGDG